VVENILSKRERLFIVVENILSKRERPERRYSVIKIYGSQNQPKMDWGQKLRARERESELSPIYGMASARQLHSAEECRGLGKRAL
jgi:hypothetical protein